jgi:PadR family transcriptional regulator AphA
MAGSSSAGVLRSGAVRGYSYQEYYGQMPPPPVTGHALLSLVALRPGSSTYELAGQVTRALRFLLPRAESRVYAEARALARRGLVRVEDESSGRRPRSVYSITDEGRAELQRWLSGPVAATRLQSEGLLRVLVGRLATPEQLLAAVHQVRADADQLIEQGAIVAAEYLQGNAPFQDDVAYRALVFDFLHHHARTLRAWADRAEAAVVSWPGEPDQPARDAALARIRALATELPQA